MSVGVKRRIGGYLAVFLVAVSLACILKFFVIDAVVIPSPSMEQTLLPGDFVFINKLVYGTPDNNAPDSSFSLSSLLKIPALRPLRRGDIIAFELPKEAEQPGTAGRGTFVKRCVAVGGDEVRIAGGYVSVNGLAAQGIPDTSVPDKPAFRIPRKGDTIRLNRPIDPWCEQIIRNEKHRVESDSSGVRIDGVRAGTYTVQRDYCFVLGDNIRHSYDSRRWGLLPVCRITGAAMMVYWSVDTRAGGFPASIRWGRIGSFIR
jgi:signal peptidase I